MAMTRGSKLFHTILLVFAWQYCTAKVGATFRDVTGFFDFDFGSFGSGGVGILGEGKNGASSANPPEMAPGIAPVGFETPINNEDNDAASSFDSEFTKNINGEVGVSNDDHKINLKSGGTVDVSNDDHKVNLKSSGTMDVSHDGITSGKIRGDGNIGLRSRGRIV